MQCKSLPTSLLAIGAALVAAPVAMASPGLPPEADAPPKLPRGVVTADRAPVSKASVQRDGAAAAARGDLRADEGFRPFWATVNICDSESSPNALGVRTSVPGSGSGQRIYGRFTAQWWSSSRQSWRTVAGEGRTDWAYLGTQGWASQQGGWTFRFDSPPQGTTYVVRGVVELSWRARARAAGRDRARWSVVRRRTLLTETGKQGVEGGDPAGTSKAFCLIW